MKFVFGVRIRDSKGLVNDYFLFCGTITVSRSDGLVINELIRRAVSFTIAITINIIIIQRNHRILFLHNITRHLPIL